MTSILLKGDPGHRHTQRTPCEHNGRDRRGEGSTSQGKPEITGDHQNPGHRQKMNEPAADPCPRCLGPSRSSVSVAGANESMSPQSHAQDNCSVNKRWGPTSFRADPPVSWIAPTSLLLCPLMPPKVSFFSQS